MKILHVSVILILINSFLSCSNREVIITDKFAYVLGDDSLSVVAEYMKIDSPNAPDNQIEFDTLPTPIKMIEPEYPKFRMGNTVGCIEANVFVKVFVQKKVM